MLPTAIPPLISTTFLMKNSPALKANFGKNSSRLETAIARKLYQKLSLEFTEMPNTELGKYVETALVKLSQREQLGFVNISSTI